MVIQHNLAALNAYRYFMINQRMMSRHLERLSSGLRINRAADDPAGLAVSEKMRSQISGLKQAVKNAEDGISMVQTYEGALNQTNKILLRMKTIATQVANGTYDDITDRAAAQLEFDQLRKELDQIADTDFNGIMALNGGRTADGKIAGADGKLSYSPADKTLTPDMGAPGETSVPNAFRAGSASLRYIDSITLQLGARSKDSVNFTFDYSAYASGIGTLAPNLDVTSRGLGAENLSIESQAAANFAIDQIEFAINKTSLARASLGAVQNRLEHRIDNLNVTLENITAAEARIRGADMAYEMMEFTKYHILMQAAQAMLAQAMKLPQNILDLLI
ncbi:MAG: flagellin [Oscillospiraceae bacterium]|nr:flagellin [Oscillospiraceae bacterium]